METMRLKDAQVLPTSEVLAEALGNSYPVFEEFIKTVKSDKYEVTGDWNYYKDGKAWLLKACYKKKTVFWLSVWEGFFKIGFYFTEKNCTGLFELNLNKTIIDDFNSCKPIGKLLPLTIDVKQPDQLHDLLKIIEYKKGLK
jgi:hypothetical protein